MIRKFLFSVLCLIQIQVFAQTNKVDYSTYFLTDSDQLGYFNKFPIVKDDNIFKVINIENILKKQDLIGIIEKDNQEDIYEIYLKPETVTRTDYIKQSYTIQGEGSVNLKETYFFGNLDLINIKRAKDMMGEYYLCTYKYRIEFAKIDSVLYELNGNCCFVVKVDKKGFTIQSAADGGELHDFNSTFVGVLNRKENNKINKYKCIFGYRFYDMHRTLPYISELSYEKLFGKEPLYLEYTDFMKKRFPNVVKFYNRELHRD